MEPPSSRTRLVVAEGNLRGFRGLTVDAFGCLLRGGPGQLPNAMRKVVGAREETRNVQSPEDLWRDTFRRYIRANPFLSFREVHRRTIQDFFKAVGISYAEDIVGASLTGMPALLMQRPGAPEEPRGEAQGTVHDLQQVHDFIRNSWKES